MIAILTTSARPQYVAATAMAVSEQDCSRGGSRVIVSDGGPAPRIDGWESIVATKPAYARQGSNKWATWTAIEEAARRGEDMLFLEDDIRICRNAIPRALRLVVPPDVAFVSLFSPHNQMPAGLWRSRMHGFAYCQAMIIPLRTCVELARLRESPECQRAQASDNAIQAIGLKQKWLYALHYPNLVQHVGAVSAVNGQELGERTSKSFRADLDALRLPVAIYD